MNWKGPIVSAAAAFLLSSLIGVISAVSWGALLFRALTAALVFGAGSYGAGILIKRFIPELLEFEARPGSREEEEAVQRVNIVLDDEESFPKGEMSGKAASPPASPQGQDADQESSDDLDRGPQEDEPQQRASSLPVHEDQDGNLFGAYGGGREGGQGTSGDGGTGEGSREGAGPAPSGKGSSSGGDEEIEDLEPLPDIESDASPRGGGEESSSSGGEDVAELASADDEEPDISSFDELEGTSGMEDSPLGGEEDALVDVNGREEDPKEMARAIQTVLKKEKG